MSAVIPLPEISYAGGLDLKSAIYERTSIRRFDPRVLSQGQLADLLWVTQGYIRSGKRAVPSAGATYPLEVYAAVAEGGVQGLSAGLYYYNHHYDTDSHSLQTIHNESVIPELAAAAYGQSCVEQAMLVIAVAGDRARTAGRYGERADRYVSMEVGHVGQNVSLMAVSLGLATVMVGAFKDDDLARALRLEGGLAPYYMMPVGYPYKP